MITDRKSLLDFRKTECKYPGTADLIEVKAFLDNPEDPIELQNDDGKPLDVAAIWKITKSFKLETTDPEEDRLSGEAHRGTKAKIVGASVDADTEKKKPSLTAEQHERLLRRKQYDRKAARGETVFPDADTAELWTASMRIAAMGNRDHEGKYTQLGRDREIMSKAGSVNNNITGGAFIPPPELSMALIELREKYGVFPAAARNEPMANDRKILARNVADQTVYWTGENSTGTESDPNLDNPSLTANKLIGLARYSFECLNDDAISLSDMTARSFARQAAFKIDDAAFNGTGSAGYGGFVGLNSAFKAISATRANIAGAVVATGDLWSEVVLNDLQYVQAKLPAYAQNTAKWYGPSQAYYALCQRLGIAAGGVTYSEIANPVPQMMFLGRPWVFVQAMSPLGLAGTAYRANCLVYYGDLSLSSTFGVVRNSLAFDMSDQRYFDVDQIAFRYRERVAILNHDVGGDTSVTTPVQQVAGPVTTLLGAAS